MRPYQQEFIEFALERKVLLFGEFTLKSGRVSPYFFNAGLFNSGAALARLSSFYAAAIEASGMHFDMLFGPAYKGIPLVAGIAVTLHAERDLDVPWSFNRKEAKDHGESGTVVGAPLHGDVLIVDDVISAGTSARESVDIIRGAGARACGLAIALDRQERGFGALSAVQEARTELGIPVISIVTLADLVEFLELRPGSERELSRVRAYREAYGVV